jgi:hypothetical protein
VNASFRQSHVVRACEFVKTQTLPKDASIF